MLKYQELLDPNSCLNRAREHERIFVLLERDIASPAGIRAWAAKRIELGKNKPTDQQIVSALKDADEMEYTTLSQAGMGLAGAFQDLPAILRDQPEPAQPLQDLPAAPLHPIEVRISIGGETREYVERAIVELAEHIRNGGGGGIASGGAGGSHSLTMACRDVTTEKFREELEQWRQALPATPRGLDDEVGYFTEETHRGVTFQNPPLSPAEIEQAKRLQAERDQSAYIKNLEAAVLIHERLVRKLQTCAVAIPVECQREYLRSLAIFGKISTAGMEASKVFTETVLELETTRKQLAAAMKDSDANHAKFVSADLQAERADGVMLLIPETYGDAVQQFGESFLTGRESHLWDNADKAENLAWILERTKEIWRDLAAAKKDAGEWKREWEMYSGAWLRELGGKLFHKTHRIDALVLTTRDMKTRADRTAELEKLLNTPEIEDFDKAVPLEAAHQVQRWTAEHGEGKHPEDWFWLLGYLAGKALSSAKSGDTKKAKHHCISSAAALRNWHAHLRSGETKMRPGIAEPAP